MKQELFQVQRAGGIQTRLPAEPINAAEAVNLVVDQRTGGWSTRIGYEPYDPDLSSLFWPFDGMGPVTSLHIAQALAGGARQHTLLEADGSLYLVFEARGTSDRFLLELASGRHAPTPTEPGSWYTDTPYGTVITNGVDQPVIVRPWPLDSSPSAATLAQCIRPFGFVSLPPSPEPYGVATMTSRAAAGSPPTLPPPPGSNKMCLWCPSDSSAISDGDRWGVGFHENVLTTAFALTSRFGYAVSFISTTGSEGPISPMVSVSWKLPPVSYGFRLATGLDVPLGPAGTVARKIYRTANFSDDSAAPDDTSLYFIGLIRNNVETVYFDAVRTSEAGQSAPDIATGPMPAPRARFSALYKGCFFLDGGLDDARTLFYSAPGLIEQFDPRDYLELSAEGGAITAIFGDYTALVVFRENSIDLVQGDYATGFQVSVLSNGITCRAPHSIKSVPGLGVLFLAQDGVYALVGGTVGGSQAQLVNLTEQMDQVTRRITPDCRPRAVAVYSATSREYQLYVPVDGNDRPNLGLVFHTNLLDGDGQPWSTREGFPVGAVAARHDGTVVFGHHTGDQDVAAGSERGLFVISGARSLGTVYDPVPQTYSAAEAPTSTYRTAWFDFGDAQTQKQVNYVTVWVLTTGQPQITVRHYKDFKLTPVEERTYYAQPPDAVDLPTFDLATLGTDTYQESRLVPIRVSIAQQSCAQFSFELETTDDLILVGWEAMYTSKGTQVIFGKRA